MEYNIWNQIDGAWVPFRKALRRLAAVAEFVVRVGTAGEPIQALSGKQPSKPSEAFPKVPIDLRHPRYLTCTETFTVTKDALCMPGMFDKRLLDARCEVRGAGCW